METMKDIKARFASAKEGEYNALFQHYENDERSGVQKLIQQYRKKLGALEKERRRIEIMKEYEHKYSDWDFNTVCRDHSWRGNGIFYEKRNE